MKLRMVIITAVFFLSMLIAPSLYAGEKEFMIHKSSDIKTLLQQQVGKTVTLGLNSGAEIIGTVTKVGDS